jgi:hypothetical protein
MWVDSALAISCLELFSRFGPGAHLDFNLLLCLYLSHSHPVEVSKYMKELSLSPQEQIDRELLTNLIWMKLTGNSPEPPTVRSLSLWREIITHWSNPVTTLRHSIFSSISAAREKSERLIAFINDTVLTIQQDGMLDDLHRRLTTAGDMWHRLWRCMRVERAPWAAYRSSAEKCWRRDSVLCHGRIAPKIRGKYPEADVMTRSPSSLSRFDGKGKNPLRMSAIETSADFLAQIVTVSGSVPALFSVRGDAIRIRRENGSSHDIPADSIIRILRRTRGQDAGAIEMFLKSGKTILVDFTGQNVPEIIAKLQRFVPDRAIIQISPYREYVADFGLTNQWVQGRMSNFEYLSGLNLLGGRSYRDLLQYPIFPWVITDYTSPELDLHKATSFRDLRKPMIATNEKRLNELITQNLKLREASFVLDRYVLTSSDVLTYLHALEPFAYLGETPMTSIVQTYQTMLDSSTQFSEAIPEFYFMPELFVNVELPKWAHESPSTFVYVMRQALESSFVSQNLHHWIDLIWGYKQRADLSFNAFRPELYDDFSGSENIDLNQLRLDAGFVPHQLFVTRHPSRGQITPKTPPSDRAHFHQLPSESLIYGTVRLDEPGVCLVLYVDSGGELTTLRLNLLKTDPSGSERPRPLRKIVSDRVRDVGSPPPAEDFPGLMSRAAIADFRSFVSPLTSSCFAAFQRTVAIVDGDKPFVSLIEISTGVRTKAQFHNSEIICVSEHKGWLASAGRDAIVNVIDVRNLKRPLFSIPLYRDEITCLTVNADFKVIASGTRDGFLVLSSLNRGSTVHVVDLQSCRPYSVLVTNSWGFVVVCSTKLKAGRLEHMLMVYNVNGMFLRSKVVSGAMKAWTTWTSADGFDFLILATEQGKVFACEVFWLDLKHVKGFHAKSPILELRYSVNDCGFVAVCQSGEVAYVPYVHAPVSV